MFGALKTLLSTMTTLVRPRSELLLEIAALRHQLDVLCRQNRRPKLKRGDRMFWIWLKRTWPAWRSALVIVQPETVLRWHRDGYRAYWRWKSKAKHGRPRIPQQHIAFIRRISSEHPEWGEDRIALELKLKLGIDHSTSTIRRYGALSTTGSTACSESWASRYRMGPQMRTLVWSALWVPLNENASATSFSRPRGIFGVLRANS